MDGSMGCRENDMDFLLYLIRDALGIKEMVGFDSSMANIPEWDSLGHISILTALDEFFDGKIGGINELVRAESVREIVRILKKKGVV